MSSNQKQSFKKKKNTAFRQVVPSSPPQYQSCLHGRQKFRFQANAPVNNLTISCADLLSIVLTVNTATTTTSIFSAFKLRKVSLWGPPAADLVPVVTSIEYVNALSNSGFGQKRFVHSDTSVGATKVAVVCAKPPPGTPCASWQNVVSATTTTNGTDFILDGPTNMIVDVDMDFVILNGEIPFTGPAVTGQAPGAIIMNTLDGGQSGILIPQNFISVI